GGFERIAPSSRGTLGEAEGHPRSNGGLIMRRLWIAAATVIALAACREEGRTDIVLGADKDKTADLQNQGERERRARIDAEDRAIAKPSDAEMAKKDAQDSGRILAMIRTISKGEVEAAMLALQRSQSKDVKDYAQRILSEHQSDVQSIEKLAKDKGYDLDS